MSSKAVAQVQRGGDKPKFALEDIPIPQPGEHELLVKNSYVAQNPTDGMDNQ
jgi:NADPH:quinone reductase-like Zn-dependent oxidoreductase